MMEEELHKYRKMIKKVEQSPLQGKAEGAGSLQLGKEAHPYL